jgi:hypothetical protein
VNYRAAVAAGLLIGALAGCADPNPPPPPGISGLEPSGCTPDLTCHPAAAQTGDYEVDCVARVNQFRTCLCLPVLARWTIGEACADEDAAYDAPRTPHAGFLANLCVPEGFAENECSGWPAEPDVIGGCLQAMFDEGPPPAVCTGACAEAHGHFVNMTNPEYTMVACGLATVNGQITAVQNFE